MPSRALCSAGSMATKTAKTVTVATALAALAGGVLGAGHAEAQTSSVGPANVDQWVQMGWSAYGDSVIKSGGFLMRDLPEGGAAPGRAPGAAGAGDAARGEGRLHHCADLLPGWEALLLRRV